MAKEKKKFYKRWWFWLIVVVIIIAAVSGGGNSDKKDTSSNKKQTSQSQDKKVDTKKEESKEEVKSRDNSSAKTKTLSTGTFEVGKDINPGRYVCKSLGGSGNFVVNKDGVPEVNEILDPSGQDGVKTVTCDLTKGESIKISSIKKVKFTPAETKMSNKLSAGTWEVGVDIKPGRYIAKVKHGSGNFVVNDNGVPEVNEILDASGESGVKTVTCDLKDGEIINISSLNEVYFESK